MKCIPVCLEILSAHFPPPNSSNHLGSGPQLWFFFFWTPWLTKPASVRGAANGTAIQADAPIVATSFAAAVTGNKHQAPWILALIAAGHLEQKIKIKEEEDDWWSSNVSHFSRSQLTAQALRILSCSVQTAALLQLLLFSLPPQILNPPSLLRLCWARLPYDHRGVSSTALLCAWEEGEHQAGKKLSQSCGHVLCCCFLTEESCLPSQEQKNASTFLCCSEPESITFPETQKRLWL